MVSLTVPFLQLTAVSSAIPLGRDKVITCYGIMGMITLATSESMVCGRNEAV